MEYPPTQSLLPPESPPARLLREVEVSSDGTDLRMSTGIGRVSLELYRTVGECDEPIRFHEQVTDLMPEDKPTRVLPPVALVPDEDPYTLVVRCPRPATDTSWSTLRRLTLGNSLSTFEIAKHFPEFTPDAPGHVFDVELLQQTRPGLGVAVRLNGKSTTSLETVSIANGKHYVYRERLRRNFLPSGTQPETTIIVIEESETAVVGGGIAKERLTRSSSTPDKVDVVVFGLTDIHYSHATLYAPNPSTATEEFGITPPVEALLSTRTFPPRDVPLGARRVKDTKPIAAFRFLLQRDIEPHTTNDTYTE